MDNTENIMIQSLQVLADKTDALIQSQLQKASYDKTYNGIITAVKFDSNTKPTDGNYNKYTVKFNLIERDFIINDGQFHSVGERVKVHIPNNNTINKYVETNVDGSRALPVTIVYDNENDTITEVYNGDLQRKFALTIENKGTENEEVTQMIFPNGSVIELKGF